MLWAAFREGSGCLSVAVLRAALLLAEWLPPSASVITPAAITAVLAITPVLVLAAIGYCVGWRPEPARPTAARAVEEIALPSGARVTVPAGGRVPAGYIDRVPPGYFVVFESS